MSLSRSIAALVRDMEKRKQDSAERQRAEWHAHHEDIPDLDFCPPDCPICWLMTEYEDGYFTCWGCDVSWPNNGYGHQACHADGTKFAPTHQEQEA
jgi:hypothetical protein